MLFAPRPTFARPYNYSLQKVTSCKLPELNVYQAKGNQAFPKYQKAQYRYPPTTKCQTYGHVTAPPAAIKC